MSRIVHLIDASAPADMLAALELLRREDEPLLSLGAPPENWPLEDVSIVHRPLWGFLGGRGLAKRLPRESVLHVWGRSALPAAFDAARRRRARLVFSLPHLPHDREELDDLPWLIGQRGLTLTVPNRRSLDILRRKGADLRRTAQLPPVAKLTFPADRRDELRRRLGLEDGELLLAVPEEMIRHSGHRIASWAHAIVREAGKRLKMVFPGHGELENTVRFFAGTTGFIEEVNFSGEGFSRAEIFAAADAVGLFYERDVGLTLPAWAIGAEKPILATKTPDLQTLLEGERTALLCEPSDPRSAAALLLRWLDDPNALRAAAREAREQAEREHSPRRVRARLDEIYGSLKPAKNV